MLRRLRNQPPQPAIEKSENLPCLPSGGGGKQLKWLIQATGLPEKKTQQ